MKMKRYRRQLLSLLVPLVVVSLLCTGCQKADEGEKKNTFKDVAAKLSPTEDDETPKTPEPPPKPTMPKTKLTEKYAAASLVNVGDTMPNAALQDIDGKPVELHSLLERVLKFILCLCEAFGHK